MDIQLAKTFLEIMSAGSLIEAAKRLHVTQTTVTARVQNLEKELGCKLFVRNRSGANLTQDGERFVEHAKRLVESWQRAKLDMQKAQHEASSLIIGVENSLWNPLISEAIALMNQDHSELTLDAQVQEPDVLIRLLIQGFIDAAVVHTPSYHSSFVAELLTEEKLIHVQSVNQPKPDLFVDWGAEFTSQYDAALPQPRKSGFKTNLGPLALKVMLNHGGNGYFRTRAVQKYLDLGELERVKHAPEFSYPIFLMYRNTGENPQLGDFINVLKVCSQRLEPWSL